MSGNLAGDGVCRTPRGFGGLPRAFGPYPPPPPTARLRAREGATLVGRARSNLGPWASRLRRGERLPAQPRRPGRPPASRTDASYSGFEGWPPRSPPAPRTRCASFPCVRATPSRLLRILGIEDRDGSGRDQYPGSTSGPGRGSGSWISFSATGLLALRKSSAGQRPWFRKPRGARTVQGWRAAAGLPRANGEAIA